MEGPKLMVTEMMCRSRTVLRVGVVVLVSLGLWTSPALAQEPPPETSLNERQIGFFQKANAALSDDEVPRAIEFYKLALKEGENNVLLAALGRAHFRGGDCAEADAAYVRALEAPVVVQEGVPSPEDVRVKIEEYRIGLRVDCSGQLALACEPGDIEVRIGDGARRPCADFPIKLEPGAYNVTAFQAGRSQDHEVRITGMETTTLNLKFEASEVVAAAPTPEVEQGGAPWGAVGWVTAGVGGAVLLTAVLLDATALNTAIGDFKDAADARSPDEDALFDDAQRLQRVVLGAYVAGVTLTAAGVVVALVAGGDAEAPEAPAEGARVDPWVSPDGAGMLFSMPW